MLDVVGDEDDAQTLRPGPDHMAQDDGCFLDPKRGRWLVEDEHPRPKIFGSCDGQGLPLATGQCADELARVADLDPDLEHLVGRDLAGAGDVEAAERTEAGGWLGTHE